MPQRVAEFSFSKVLNNKKLTPQEQAQNKTNQAAHDQVILKCPAERE